MTARNHQRIFIAAFLVPPLLLYTTFVAIPSVRALLYSLRHWDGFAEPTWAGLDNFARLIADGDLFWTALRNNLILVGGAGTLTIGMGLFFAAMLHRGVRGGGLFRVAFFFPNMLAAVAVALLWVLLYSATDFGVFNAGLAHLRDFALAWSLPWPDVELPFPFLDSSYLIYAIIPMVAWASVGFYMVLFYAAMSGIPESYYEAARLDGASGVQQFFHVTLPLIREALAVGVVFFIITTFKFFDPIWVMENQRPARESHVLATLLYQQAFTDYDIGYGSAVAVVLFALVFVATLVSLRLTRGERVEY